MYSAKEAEISRKHRSLRQKNRRSGYGDIYKRENALGYNILWGHRTDKLYHSMMTFEESQKIGALVKGQDYYVRVDAFNENGITEGNRIVK